MIHPYQEKTVFFRVFRVIRGENIFTVKNDYAFHS